MFTAYEDGPEGCSEPQSFRADALSSEPGSGPVRAPLAANIFFSALRFVVVTALALGVTRAILHYLGPQLYGIYALAASVGSVLVVLDFGVATYLIRLAAETDIGSRNEHTRRILEESASVYLLWGVAVAIVVGVLAGPLAAVLNIPAFQRSLAAALFAVQGVTMLMRFPAIALTSRFEGAQAYRSINMVILLSYGVYAAIISVLIAMHASIVVLSIAPAVMYGFMFISFAHLGRQKFDSFRLRWIGLSAWRQWRPVIRAGTWYFAHSLVSMAIYSSDLLLVAAFFPPLMSANYSLGQRIPLLLLAFGWTATEGLYPFLAAGGATMGRMQMARLFLALGRLIIELLAPFVAIIYVYSGSVFVLWVGQVYPLASQVLRLLLIALLFDLPQLVSVRVLYARGDTRFLLYVTSGGAICKIALSTLLARYRGPVGIAEAAILTLGAMSLLTGARALSCLGVRWAMLASTLRRMALPLLVVIVWSFFGYGSSITTTLTSVVALLLSYGFALWTRGLTKRERRALMTKILGTRLRPRPAGRC